MTFFEKVSNLFGTGTEAYPPETSEDESIDEIMENIKTENTIESDVGWHVFGYGSRTDSGVVMNPRIAMEKVATVYACVDRRATALAKLPFDVYKRGGNNRERDSTHSLNKLLKRRPNKFQSPMAYKKYIMVSQLLWGFAIIYKKYNYKGEIEELIPWNPEEVTIRKVYDKYEYLYSYRGVTYTEEEVIYIPYISIDGKTGKAPLKVARESAGAILQMTKHLNTFYKNGAIRQGALVSPSALAPGAKVVLKKLWAKLFGGVENTGEPAVLDNGLDWKDISLPLKDAEFIESKRLTAIDIAAIFNVPPTSVGLSAEKYSNLQEINERWMQDVIQPDCINIEEAHNYSCFLDRESDYYVKFNLSAGMRATDKKRAEFYKEMIAIGVMTINEVRQLEDLNGIGELGDKHYASLNYTTLETLEKHERIKSEKNV